MLRDNMRTRLGPATDVAAVSGIITLSLLVVTANAPVLGVAAPVLGSLIGGLGTSWGATLTQQGWLHCRHRLLCGTTPENLDLQKALIRALRNSSVCLQKQWRQTNAVEEMRRNAPDFAAEQKEAFDRLIKTLDGLFLSSELVGIQDARSSTETSHF